jgi:hypothetical protein
MAGISVGLRGTFGALGLAALALAFVANPREAAAVVPQPTGFQLDISPSARILDALDRKRNSDDMTAQEFYDIVYDESCDNPHLRIRARNKPAIMITNFDGTILGNAASVAPITSFSLKINDPGAYIFGNGDNGDSFTDFIKKTSYVDAGVSITGSSLSADKKTLTVNFDGLTAGKSVVFNIDLDTTDPNNFMYPDYRMILCGSVDDPTPTPATATATFVNSASPAPNSVTRTVEFAQLNAPVQYVEEDIRPYHDMDKMEYREMSIPEPSAGLLSLAGVVAVVLRSRSRKVAG